MNHTRAFAFELRTAAEVTPAMVVRAADTIATLCDVIEALRLQPSAPAPRLDLGPLRQLRKWHHEIGTLTSSTSKTGQAHRDAAKMLNSYFPEDDQL